MKPWKSCNHTRRDGSRCHAPANKTGKCPLHAKTLTRTHGQRFAGSKA